METIPKGACRFLGSPHCPPSLPPSVSTLPKWGPARHPSHVPTALRGVSAGRADGSEPFSTQGGSHRPGPCISRKVTQHPLSRSSRSSAGWHHALQPRCLPHSRSQPGLRRRKLSTFIPELTCSPLALHPDTVNCLGGLFLLGLGRPTGDSEGQNLQLLLAFGSAATCPAGRVEAARAGIERSPVLASVPLEF